MYCTGELPVAYVVVCQSHVDVATVSRVTTSPGEVTSAAQCTTETVGCRQTHS